MAKIKTIYNPQNEVPDATGISGERVNSWKLFMEDELASDSNDVEDEEEQEDYESLYENSDVSFLCGLGLDADTLSYAQYCWEKSEEEDRRRGL